jgi:Mpv17 / PMP22 family
MWFLLWSLELVKALSLPQNFIQSTLVSLKNNYVSSLSTNPMLTNVATAGVLAVCSDCISQNIEIAGAKKLKEVRPFSFYRSFCMSVYGASVLGWFVSHWFNFLNYLVPKQDITLPRVFLKVFINQLCMSPFLNSLFFGYVIFTRDFKNSLGQKVVIYKQKLDKDLLPTIMRSCVYWSIVHIYNFLSCPPQYQLLYTNMAFVIWTAYISFVGYKRS